jgi:tripartite-type tricarboxylate transporter receptor subunit TctC
VLTPDVPTLSEQGLTGFDTSIWYGIFAPKGTPDAIVNAVSDVLQRAAASPDVKGQLAANGADPVAMGHDEFSRFVQSDLQKWEKIVNTAKIKPE